MIEIEKSLHVAPDGGYGWVICAAGFFSHILVEGLNVAFGFHLLGYQRSFHTDVANLNFSKALSTTTLLLQGKKFSGRSIIIDLFNIFQLFFVAHARLVLYINGLLYRKTFLNKRL